MDRDTLVCDQCGRMDAAEDLAQTCERVARIADLKNWTMGARLREIKRTAGTHAATYRKMRAKGTKG